MDARRLDVRVHLVTGAVTAVQNIVKCVHRCGLEVVDWFYTLSELELNYGRHNFNGKVVNTFRKALYTVNPELAVKSVGGFSLLVLAK